MSLVNETLGSETETFGFLSDMRPPKKCLRLRRLKIKSRDCLETSRLHPCIVSITNKATRMLNFVGRNIYNCPSETKVLACVWLVRPHMEYAVAALDPHLYIHQLEKVQWRAARFVYRDYHCPTSVTNLLDRLHWPPLVNKRKTACLCLFYKSVHNLSVISTSHLHKPTRFTRNSDDMRFQTLLTQTDAYKFSCFTRTIIDWNQLDCETRFKPPIYSFRHSLLLSTCHDTPALKSFDSWLVNYWRTEEFTA
jgi:hypothetical protein